MNTDRGLLELAARTLGVKWKWVGGDKSGALYVLRESAPKGDWHEWNPIRDDGDALRLAVKLHISVWVDDSDACCSWAPAGQHPFAEGMAQLAEEIVGGDPYAATRRAIVRAAAEIGRGME